MTLGSGNVPDPALVRFGEDRNYAALPFAQEAIMDGEAHSPTRSDVYQSITACIIEAIEAGAGEFHMPWHGNGSSIAKPENALTHMDYHGVNVLALWAQAHKHHYQSGHWASYRQWQELGAQVTKGQRGSVIVFFKKLESNEEREDNANQPRLFARASYVFNADQVEGWKPPIRTVTKADFDPMESVTRFVAGTKANVRYDGQSACYHLTGDYIEMPGKERFVGSPTSSPVEAFSATLLHELVHWSGARHRLSRLPERGFTLTDRSMEELTAEIGAAYLCADLWVSNVPRPDHAAYVASWLKILKEDTKAIFRAARQANLAAMFLHELAGMSARL